MISWAFTLFYLLNLKQCTKHYTTGFSLLLCIYSSLYYELFIPLSSFFCKRGNTNFVLCLRIVDLYFKGQIKTELLSVKINSCNVLMMVCGRGSPGLLSKSSSTKIHLNSSIFNISYLLAVCVYWTESLGH